MNSNGVAYSVTQVQLKRERKGLKLLFKVVILETSPITSAIKLFSNNITDRAQASYKRLELII
jgi:hypothetical protein